jgi:hypothetical protein
MSNILIKDGKVYFNGEPAGEIDSGNIEPGEQPVAAIDMASPETILINIPFQRPRITAEFRKLLRELEVPRYGPCIDCGNPAKNCLCFKCKQKRMEYAD